jgi:hypothetical protein
MSICYSTFKTVADVSQAVRDYYNPDEPIMCECTPNTLVYTWTNHCVTFYRDTEHECWYMAG